MNYLFKNTYIIDTEIGAESEFYMDKFEMDHEDNFVSKITCNKSLLSGPYLAE